MLFNNNYTSSTHVFPNKGWTIYLGNKKQNRLKTNKIYEHITQYDSLHYWQNKLYCHDPTHIDWPAPGRTLSALPYNLHQWSVKHATGHFGNGVKLKLWEHQSDNDCLFWDLQETPQHILRCTHPKVQQTWQSSLAQLQAKLHSLKTEPTITTTGAQPNLCLPCHRTIQYTNNNLLDGTPCSSDISPHTGRTPKLNTTNPSTANYHPDDGPRKSSDNY